MSFLVYWAHPHSCIQPYETWHLFDLDPNILTEVERESSKNPTLHKFVVDSS